jgi:hypothetical protein
MYYLTASTIVIGAQIAKHIYNAGNGNWITTRSHVVKFQP